MNESSRLDSTNTPQETIGTTGADLKQAASAVGQEAKAQAEALVEEVKDQAEPLRRNAETFAEGKKQQNARRMKDFAGAIHKAADDIAQESPATARYIHASAEKLENAAATMSEKSVGELFDDASRMASERPFAGFAGSLAAGFLLARLLRASASPNP